MTINTCIHVLKNTCNTAVTWIYTCNTCHVPCDCDDVRYMCHVMLIKRSVVPAQL